jgi:hypothetical protein
MLKTLTLAAVALTSVEANPGYIGCDLKVCTLCHLCPFCPLPLCPLPLCLLTSLPFASLPFAFLSFCLFALSVEANPGYIGCDLKVCPPSPLCPLPLCHSFFRHSTRCLYILLLCLSTLCGGQPGLHRLRPQGVHTVPLTPFAFCPLPLCPLPLYLSACLPSLPSASMICFSISLHLSRLLLCRVPCASLALCRSLLYTFVLPLLSTLNHMLAPAPGCLWHLPSYCWLSALCCLL